MSIYICSSFNLCLFICLAHPLSFPHSFSLVSSFILTLILLPPITSLTGSHASHSHAALRCLGRKSPVNPPYPDTLLPHPHPQSAPSEDSTACHPCSSQLPFAPRSDDRFPRLPCSPPNHPGSLLLQCNPPHYFPELADAGRFCMSKFFFERDEDEK